MKDHRSFYTALGRSRHRKPNYGIRAKGRVSLHEVKDKTVRTQSIKQIQGWDKGETVQNQR